MAAVKASSAGTGQLHVVLVILKLVDFQVRLSKDVKNTWSKGKSHGDSLCL